MAHSGHREPPTTPEPAPSESPGPRRSWFARFRSFPMSFPHLRRALRRPFRHVMLAVVGLVCTAVAASAHEGHDHGAAPAPLPAATKPRVAVQTDAFELVGIAAGVQMSLFLDKFATNEPVTDAEIEVLPGAESVKAEPRPDAATAPRSPRSPPPAATRSCSASATP